MLSPLDMRSMQSVLNKKRTKPTLPQEQFVIESGQVTGNYYSGQYENGSIKYNAIIKYAVKFNSVNSALQFNRIINGRIITIFN